MQVTFYTEKAEVEKQMVIAKEIFKARDLRTKDLRDEAVDVFYECTLCQRFLLGDCNGCSFHNQVR
jgi:acetyl-CoA decarbonylase/synthase, CODH/ACS complex subunit beta